jgi:hypothetical protein
MYSAGEATVPKATESLNKMNTAGTWGQIGSAANSALSAIGSIYAQVVAARMQIAQYDYQKYVTNLQQKCALDGIDSERATIQDVETITESAHRVREDLAQSEADLAVAEAELAQSRETRSFGRPSIRI